ncbi:hypothetical protein ACP70R_033526 [Stipagrostis hirtigluma subsp. patula]
MAAAVAKLDEAPILAAANYGVLPLDVLSDVLLRLPADELCRLRLVCRSWRSLTADPIFAKAHSSCHSNVAAIHCQSGEVHIIDLSGNILKRIHMEHHGHNLTAQLDLLYVSIGTGHQAHVLNMFTGMVEHRTQPSSSTLTSVFGYVPSTGEYKVLRILWRKACEVITLCSGNNMEVGGRGQALRYSSLSGYLPDTWLKLVVSPTSCSSHPWPLLKSSLTA